MKKGKNHNGKGTWNIFRRLSALEERLAALEAATDASATSGDLAAVARRHGLTAEELWNEFVTGEETKRSFGEERDYDV